MRRCLMLAAWGGCIAVGMAGLVSYELTPAAMTPAASDWPFESKIVRERRRPTLVTFIHPRCPCSRASISELAVLASECGDRLSMRIVFVRPPGFREGWEHTGLWKAAQRIPGAIVQSDPEGVEARRFHAATSGETFLFDPGGKLLFQGGVTASRGHEGDNIGRSTLAALVRNGHSPRDRCPVFGCALSHGATTDGESQCDR